MSEFSFTNKSILTASFPSGISYRSKYYNSLKNNTIFNIDYSEFENHVFLNSAYFKLNKALYNIQSLYPRNGTEEEYYEYLLSSSHYEKDLIENQYPSYRGYYFSETDTGASYSPFIKLIDPNNEMTLSGTDGFTVEFWYGASTGTNTETPISFYSSFVSTEEYKIYCELDKTTPLLTVGISVFDGSSTYTSECTTDYSDFLDSWHKIAFVLEPRNITANTSKLHLYIDNLLIQTHNITSNADKFDIIKLNGDDKRHLYIGDNQDNTKHLIDANIKDVRFWKRGFTQDQLWGVYNTTVFSEDDLIFNITFNDPFMTNTLSQFLYNYCNTHVYGVFTGSAPEYVNNISTSLVSGTVTGSDGSDLLSANSYINPPIQFNQKTVTIGDTQYTFPNHPLIEAFVDAQTIAAENYDRSNEENILTRLQQYCYSNDDNYAKFAFFVAEILDEYILSVKQFKNVLYSDYTENGVIPENLIENALEHYGLEKLKLVLEKDFLLTDIGRNQETEEQAYKDLISDFSKRLLTNWAFFLKSKGTNKCVRSFLNLNSIDESNYRIKDYYVYSENEHTNNEYYQIYTNDNMIHFTGSDYFLSEVSFSSDWSYSVNEFRVQFTPYTTYESGSFFKETISSQPTISTGSLVCCYTGSSTTTEYYRIYFKRPLNSNKGYIVLETHNDKTLSTNEIEIFDGNFYNVFVGNNDGSAAIAIYKLNEDDTPTLIDSVSGLVNDSVDYDLTNTHNVVIGSDINALDSSIALGDTEFKIHEYRLWQGGDFYETSDMEAHVKDYKKYGRENLTLLSKLMLHYKFDDNLTTDAITGELDVYNFIKWFNTNCKIEKGTYYGQTSYNPFYTQKMKRNIHVDSIDIKYTNLNENLVEETNSLIDTPETYENYLQYGGIEFNYFDYINEEILKCLASIDFWNIISGNNIEKHRARGNHSLHCYRRQILENSYLILGKPHLNNYITLLQWVNNNIVDIINSLSSDQKFGSGQTTATIVVENHILERNQYWYPRTTINVITDLNPLINSALNLTETTFNRYDPYYIWLVKNNSHIFIPPGSTLEKALADSYRFWKEYMTKQQNFEGAFGKLY